MSSTNILSVEGVCVASEDGSRSKAKPSIGLQPNAASRLVFVTEPTGLAVEQYKMLRRRLCSLHPEGGVLLITSPARDDGKTLTSVNLAWCLADGGHRTCLVDLDFRAPSVASALNYTVEEKGIDDVLAGAGTLSDALLKVGNRSLFVLPVRQSSESPGELLSGGRLALLLVELRKAHEWVILDLPPAVPTADVVEVLPHVDGGLLIVRANKTDKSSISGPVEILGSKLWGVVLNDAIVDGSAYYSYYGEPSRSR